MDYKEVFASAKKNDLIYMDPPYQGVCGDRDLRYLSGISHDEFAEALARLNAKGISYIVSYDGRRGDRVFGELLPDTLGLMRIEIEAGRSSQSTLLGRDEITYESLYLSEALMQRLDHLPDYHPQSSTQQYMLLEPRTQYEEAFQRVP